MPLMYQQNTLQMEWCLNCHRNPAENLRPTSEIYNMAWAGPSTDKPVWCTTTQNTNGTNVPTAQGVSCVTKDPGGQKPEVAWLQSPNQLRAHDSASPEQPSLHAGQPAPQSGTHMEPNAT